MGRSGTGIVGNSAATVAVKSWEGRQRAPVPAAVEVFGKYCYRIHVSHLQKLGIAPKRLFSIANRLPSLSLHTRQTGAAGRRNLF
jgi:hypothetical protein